MLYYIGYGLIASYSSSDLLFPLYDGWILWGSVVQAILSVKQPVLEL